MNGANSVAIDYDPDGLTTQIGALALTRDTRTGDVTSTTLGGVRTSLAYSTFGEPDSTSATFNGSSLLSTRYLHDALGRIVSKTEQVAATATTFAFRYDSAGRLTTVLRDGVETESYEFDANGNRIRATTGAGTVVGSYDAQDRLRTYGSAVYTYTLNGELRRRISGTDTTRYSYDAFGQLRAVRLASGDSIEYVLDATGRRVGKRVNGTRVRGWLYSGPLSILAELDGAGAVVSRFVYVQRPNVPEYMVRGGQTYRLVTDELGSVRLVVNTATGAIAQQVDYDTFGRVTRNTSPGFQPFGFAGGLYDESTGLVRFGRRDHDAETGRWLTKDPLSFRSADLNLYA